MGSSVSHVAARPPPPSPVGLAVALPQKEEKKSEKKVDYLNLPCPVRYAEIQQEASTSLTPELFEGLRCDFIKELNQKFSLSHRVLTDGTLNARVKCDLTDHLTCRIGAQLTKKPHWSHGVFSFEYKGKDFRAQYQMGNNAFYDANYIQVATAKFESPGRVALSYVQKVSEKVSLASDFLYCHIRRDATSSFGYDYNLRQCRLRGKLNSNGCVAAFLEEQLNIGANLILSAEIDHRKNDYKFGFGITVGEQNLLL